MELGDRRAVLYCFSDSLHIDLEIHPEHSTSRRDGPRHCAGVIDQLLQREGSCDSLLFSADEVLGTWSWDSFGVCRDDGTLVYGTLQFNQPSLHLAVRRGVGDMRARCC